MDSIFISHSAVNWEKWRTTRSTQAGSPNWPVMPQVPTGKWAMDFRGGGSATEAWAATPRWQAANATGAARIARRERAGGSARTPPQAQLVEGRGLAFGGGDQLVETGGFGDVLELLEFLEGAGEGVAGALLLGRQGGGLGLRGGAPLFPAVQIGP